MPIGNLKLCHGQIIPRLFFVSQQHPIVSLQSIHPCIGRILLLCTFPFPSIKGIHGHSCQIQIGAQSFRSGYPKDILLRLLHIAPKLPLFAKTAHLHLKVATVPKSDSLRETNKLIAHLGKSLLY